MKIVFLSHASLGAGFVVGSHQLAKALITSGNNVFHISSPVSLLHVFLGKQRREKFFYALKNRKHVHSVFGFIDFIPVCLAPMGYANWLDAINNRLINRQIMRHIGKDKADLVLIDQPQLYKSLDLFDDVTKVYRPTDLYSEMGGSKFALPELKAIENSQGFVATSSQVYAHIQTLTDKPGIIVTNGVDYDLFCQASNQLRQDKCIYVGAIDFRFDLQTALTLAENNPEIVFDYYGPVAIEFIADMPENLVFHGSIDYAEIPALLTNYKYSIIPMNDHKSNDGRSPMKLYEFLAAGIPVLSRKTISIHQEMQPGVLLYENDEEVLTKFSELKEMVTDHSADEFRAIASKQSWKEKAQTILKFCDDLKDHTAI
jgi:teichuronic acid biosynthesis glycosyltransferase TuaH